MMTMVVYCNICLMPDKIDTTGLLTSDNRSTITKMRILGDRQQMMRLDFETITDLTSEEEKRLSAWLENLCKGWYRWYCCI